VKSKPSPEERGKECGNYYAEAFFKVDQRNLDLKHIFSIFIVEVLNAD